MKKLLVLFAWWSFGAIAQTYSLDAKTVKSLEGTIYTTPHRQSVDGAVNACGFKFAAFVRDFSTKNGALVQILGSFHFHVSQPPMKMAYVLKLGLVDGVFTESNSISTAPSNAFIRSASGITPKKAIRSDAEDVGSALFIGSIDDDVVSAYIGIVEQNKLIVGFNRKPGQQDVVSTIDLKVIDSKMVGSDVIREKSDQPVSEFQGCFKDLIKIIGAN